MDDEGPSPNTGAARLIVLLSAFGLATVGAFMAFFATDVVAVLLRSSQRPSRGALLLCALVPVAAAIGAAVVTVRASAATRILALGCGTLLLGALVTFGLILVIAV